MEKIYNKLVRDNIPDIIEKDNEIPVTRILSIDEYRVELYKKLKEECNELISAKGRENILYEVADVFEVLKSIAELEGMSIDDVMEASKHKRLKRGGFSKRIFLIKSIKKD